MVRIADCDDVIVIHAQSFGLSQSLEMVCKAGHIAFRSMPNILFFLGYILRRAYQLIIICYIQ